MKLTEKLGRIFQTDAHVAREAEKIAAGHFPQHQREIARGVVLSLVSVLCVNVEQIRPQADIVKDLCADEDWEWGLIARSIEAHLHRKLPLDRPFEGRTVSELIEYVASTVSRSHEKT